MLIFFKLSLKNIEFKDCRLHEVDFTEAILTNAAFLNCDLQRAVFDNSILEGADFRTAYHFSINPQNNRIKKAKFSHNNIAGLLDTYQLSIT